MINMTIGGKEYTIKYDFEASLYGDCVDKVMGLMADVYQSENDRDLKAMITTTSDIPQTTLTMFYAGLLEYHGANTIHGDGSVTSVDDAKVLMAQYLNEHSGEEDATVLGMFGKLSDCMADDGFFNKIGLTDLMGGKQPAKKQATKRKAIATKEAGAN